METSNRQYQLQALSSEQTKQVSGGKFAGAAGLVFASFKLGWDIGSYTYDSYIHYRYNSR